MGSSNTGHTSGHNLFKFISLLHKIISSFLLLTYFYLDGLVFHFEECVQLF